MPGADSAKHETIRRHQKSIYQASKNIYIVKTPGAKGLTGILIRRQNYDRENYQRTGT